MFGDLLQAFERGMRVLELDREVTAVEAAPVVFPQVGFCLQRTAAETCGERRTALRQENALEEGDELVAVLDQAVGLGLDVEMENLPARLAAARGPGACPARAA